jgi:xanthine dehydrogenase FAD-binding subunit
LLFKRDLVVDNRASDFSPFKPSVNLGLYVTQLPTIDHQLWIHLMIDFEYEAPTSLTHALAVLAETDGSAKPLAGGTDLIDQVRTGRLSPSVVVDVKKIAELNVLDLGSEGLRLGAAVSCVDIYGHIELSQQYAALTDSCRIIGGIQIQSRASVGGNICNSGPAADSTPSVIVLGGVCVISGPNGTREIPAEDFCTGPSKNVLQPGELLVEIKFPARAANSGSHYRRFIPRNEMDIAVVGVGASVELDDSKENFVSARIALGAVGPTPLFAQAAGDALAGQPVNEESIAKAAAVAKETATPISDMRGPAEYRTHLTGVLTQRVIEAAVARARGESICHKVGQ